VKDFLVTLKHLCRRPPICVPRLSSESNVLEIPIPKFKIGSENNVKNIKIKNITKTAIRSANI